MPEKHTAGIVPEKHTYGLVGYPLGHSFSAGYFAQKFQTLGLDQQGYEYRNFPVEDIAALRNVLPSSIQGFNITIPHKEHILALLSDLDPAAREIGAVNCVKILPSGSWRGYNTDAYGFGESLMNMLRHYPTSVPTLKALVLGTGGAAKAVWYALEQMGVSFRKVSRTPDQEVLGYGDLTPERVSEHRLIINTTPLGMAPRLEGKPDIPYDGIGREHFLCDLVYNPSETAFLREGRTRGAWIKNGLEMLILQAERSWDIWQSDTSEIR